MHHPLQEQQQHQSVRSRQNKSGVKPKRCRWFWNWDWPQTGVQQGAVPPDQPVPPGGGWAHLGRTVADLIADFSL